MCRIWHRQRLHLEDVLPGQTQNRPAGHQQAKLRATLKQLREQPGGARQVLEIIQHQQQVPPSEMLLHSVGRTVSFPLPQTQRGGNGRGDNLRVLERGE